MFIYRHEDGTVRFWDASGVALTPLYKLSTANVFHTDCDPSEDPQDPSDDPDMQQEEEWPPFRKVSTEEAKGNKAKRVQVFPLRSDTGLYFTDCENKKCVCFRHTLSPETLHLWPNFPI